MGVVYRAYDVELASDVAIKSLVGLSPQNLYHLKQEFRALADIRHPNLIELYELFASDRLYFFTMELIIGGDLVSYVRASSPDGSFDESRFRDTARQLALAVAAVHANMKLHRDIKPSNVMVTLAGRLVLVDFGLAVAMSVDAGKAEGGTPVGTRGYMAPEQLRGEELTPAADWYGVGATLFEAASGRLPFDHPLKALAVGPPRVRTHVPHFPQDLDELIADLLEPLASRRPNGPDVLLRLGIGSLPATSGGPAPSVGLPSAFEGRNAEMAALQSALEDVHAKKTAVVHVHGPSGVGKSELARRFVEKARSAGAAVLRGRCHPQEAVAYNALDGAIDDLSRLLASMQPSEVHSLDPADADALIRIFPVLGRIAPISERAQGVSGGTGAEGLRRATRALKDLLASLGRRKPLVVWIDDAQWGDQGSGTLIRELLSDPGAPQILLLLTYRSDDGDVSPTLDALRSVGSRPGLASVDLPLAPLSEEETRGLIERLLDVDEGGVEQFARLARETNGLPFFIQELARYIAAAPTRDESVPSRIRLGDILRARTQQVDDVARRILEVVSVAGGPLEQRVLLGASGVVGASRRALALLERECLIKTVAIDEDRRTEVYHHQIRDEVLSVLTDDVRRSHHRALADSMLTAERPRLARVVEHYDAAGDVAAVRRYVVAAAKDAASALAFDLSARLYRQAIAIGGTDLDEAELHARLGDVLASAGQDRLAGAAFERAAELEDLQDPVRGRAPYVRKRAAEQHFKSGQRREAERVLAAVLAPIGLTLPKTRRDAFRQTLLNRVILLVRGLGFERRATSEVPPGVIDRLDLIHLLAMTVGIIDYNMGSWLGTILLREALDVGETSRLKFALANECALWAPTPGSIAQGQVDRMFDLLGRLCAESDAPLYRAGYQHCHGLICWFRGDFIGAYEHLDRAIALFREIRAGVAFRIATCEAFRLPALAQLGRVRQLALELETALRDAEDRGDDLFINLAAAGTNTIAWLAVDRPEEALRWAERVRRAAQGDHATLYYYHLVSSVQIELYQGKSAEAAERIEGAWQALERNHFLSIMYVRDELSCLRARAAIAVAAAIRSGGASPRAGWGPDRWLALALREAKSIERHKLPFGAPLARLLRAGAAAVHGDRPKAIPQLHRAADEFQAIGMSLHRHVAEYCLGSSGQTMIDEGVVSPSKLVALLAPGLVPDH